MIHDNDAWHFISKLDNFLLFLDSSQTNPSEPTFFTSVPLIYPTFLTQIPHSQNDGRT